MRLLIIGLGTLLVVAFVWTTMWFWGQGLSYKPYDNPLLSWERPRGKPRLALSTNDIQQAKDFLQRNPQGILELNLLVSRDGLFFTADSQDLQFIDKLPQTDPKDFQGSHHYDYDFAFLQSHAPHIIPAEKWLQLKPAFWILNIEDNATGINNQVVSWVEKNKISDKSVFTSDVDVVITSLKEKKPLWIYGTSFSDLTKILTLASVRLESIASFNRDYFITPVRWDRRYVLNHDVIGEMRRRFKKVAIGPVHTDQDRARALTLKPDILILGPELAGK